MFFITLQESLKLLKDSIPGLIYKDCSATFKFLPPCWNELLLSKTAHLDCKLHGHPSQIICSRNFKNVATLRLRKDQDNSVL